MARQSKNTPHGPSPKERPGPFARRLFAVWLTVLVAYAILLVPRLANTPTLPWTQLVPFGAFTVATILEFAVLRSRTSCAETRLFLLATFLSGIGIAMQFRMGTFADGGGLGFMTALPLGFAAMLAVYLLARGERWGYLSTTGYLCYGLSVAMLLAMVLLGRKYRGGVYLPGNLNPSEIVKPLLVIFLASFLCGRKRDFSETQIGIPMPPAKTFFLFAILWAVPVGLVLLLHDLGLLLLLNATMVVMLYAIGRKAGYLILGGIGVAASGWLVWLTSAHARARIDAWLHPFEDPTGSGWQILQSLSAMNAGGIWGAGIGAGAPQAVPIVTSDFVYAAVAEELGIILCGLIVLLYGSLLWRGWRIASYVRSPFGALLSTGLTAAFGFQILLNLGGVTKALPLTGIVLPFLSQGGSSLVTMLAMIGLLGAISDRTAPRR